MASLIPKEEKTLSEKLAILDKITGTTNKKYGRPIMGRIGQSPEIMEKLEINFIRTPIAEFNKAIGGFPRAHMSIVTGEPDSGKTSLLLNTLAYNMRIDDKFVAAWLESEHSLEKDYVVNMFGIDPDRFMFIPLDERIGTEDTLDIVEGLLAADAVDMMCINSLRCLVPTKEKEKSIGEESIALQARLNSKLMRRWTPIVGDSSTAFVIVQHLSTAIGGYGDSKILAGGEAIRYWSALTVDLRKRSMKDTDPISREEGMKIGVSVKKNHCTPTKYPYVKFDYFVIYGQGVEEVAPAMSHGIEQGILEQHGAWLYWMKDDEIYQKFRSRADFRNRMKNEPKLWNEFRALLNGEEIENMTEEEIAAAKASEEMDAEAVKSQEKIAEKASNKKAEKKTAS